MCFDKEFDLVSLFSNDRRWLEETGEEDVEITGEGYKTLKSKILKIKTRLHLKIPRSHKTISVQENQWLGGEVRTAMY